MDEDEALSVHRASVAHLEACEEAFLTGTDGPESAPYDGCYDCQTREVLHAAWPLLGRLLTNGIADSFLKLGIARTFTAGEVARLLREFEW